MLLEKSKIRNVSRISLSGVLSEIKSTVQAKGITSDSISPRRKGAESAKGIISDSISQRRKDAESAKVFVVLFFILFLVISCSMDEQEFRNVQFVPVGEWSDGFGGIYKITKNVIEYDDGWDFCDFKGTIESSVDFTNNSGVLIVKIESSKTGITPDSYIGVYYKGYTTSHVFLANAIDETYTVIEQDSYNDAEKLFSAHNVGTHVTHWGSGYSK